MQRSLGLHWFWVNLIAVIGSQMPSASQRFQLCMILPFAVLPSKMSSVSDFSEVWTRQRLWFSDSTSNKQMQHERNQIKWKFLFVKYNSEREKKNQWVHKKGTSAIYSDESSSMESESKRWLRSRRTYKHEWTTNFIQALRLAKNWLIGGKKICWYQHLKDKILWKLYHVQISDAE